MGDTWPAGLHELHCRDDRCSLGCDCPCHRGEPVPQLPNSQVVGLDLSLTSSGWASCGLPAADAQPESISTGRIEPPDKCLGHARMEFIRGAVRGLTLTARLIIIEAPVTYIGRGTAIIDQSGLSWLIRHDLWERSKPYALVPPPNLKLYATGKGGGKDADKFAVVQAAMRRFPEVMFSGPDEADALWLMAMGADHLRSPFVVMPVAHRKALDKIIWPEVPRA